MRQPSGRKMSLAVGLIAAALALASGCTAVRTGTGSSSTSIPSASIASASVAAPAEPTTVPTGIDYAAMKRELGRRVSADREQLDDIRSVVLSVDGRTVLSYYNHRAPRDHAHVWSVTKSVTSMLVGIATGEGRLRLDQTLPELLPEHAADMTEQQKRITLRQLLTMTAGVPGDDGGLNLETDEPVDLLLAYGLSDDPGAQFIYSNSSAQLVATILRRAIDRPILDYAREKIFDPLGIDTRPAWEGTSRYSKDGFDEAGFAWQKDQTGTATGPFGLRLTTPDLVKLGELMLNGGRWHGQQLVPADWVAASTSPQLTPEQAQNGQYGYFWWILDTEPRIPGYIAAGSYYQTIRVIPSRRIVLVTTGADAEAGDDDLRDSMEPVLEDVVLEPLLK